MMAPDRLPIQTDKPEPRTRQFSAAFLLLVFQPLLFFWRVIVTPRAHIPFDIEGFHLPLTSYIAQSVHRGIAPLWDPYFYGGVPIHADSNAQLFNPFTWFAIFAASHSHERTLFYWVEFLVPLYMILAGLFAFWLLRRMGLRLPVAFFGATVYQLGGYFASQAQHLGAICAAAWLPLAVLAVFELRQQVRLRWIAVLGLAVSMSILAGFVAATLVIGVAVLFALAAFLILREASWRSIPATAAGLLLGALISTVELVPLWQLSEASMASLRGAWYMDGGGLPIQSLVSLIAPNYYHIFEPALYKLPFNYTFLYIYCGLATAVLLAFAPFFGKARGRVFLLLTVVCTFWMLGEHTPVYHSLYVRLPALLRGAIYSEYALMAFCLFAGITAALVFDRLPRRVPEALLWAIALATSYDLIHTGAARPMNSHDGGYKQEDPEHRLSGSKELADDLRQLVDQTNPPSRVDYMDRLLPSATLGADMLGIPTADGNNPFILRRMLYLRRLFCGGNYWERDLPVNRPASPILGMLNVAWLVRVQPLSDDQVRAAGLELKGEMDGVWVYRNPRALPRFFLPPRIRSSPGESATFQMLARPDFDPSAEAIVEDLPADEANLATAPIEVKAYTPNRIQLAVTTSAPAFLVTSEPMYTGWQATVNGKLVPLRMTNGAFRGLALSAGANQIVLEYRPPFLGLYLAFSSILGLMTLAVALCGERLWRRKAIAAEEPSFDWAAALRSLVPERPTFWFQESMAALNRHRVTFGWLALFIPTILLYYWKILLTKQFSLLTEREGVSQAYAWLRFWVSSIRHGELPLWDLYTFSGHSFAGEMQTAAFYPLHLVLALFPLNGHHVLSPYLYHAWWAGAHLLGAWFLFLLAREFGLSRFSAFVAGLCFSLGGFVARMGWPHMLESSIWLPLIFLFFLRAIHASESRRLLLNAVASGLALGMSILAGGFHIVIMQCMVVVSAAVFFALARAAKTESPFESWLKAGTVVAVISIVGAAAGAVQLLPSMEYTRQAIRFLGGTAGAIPANEKIPYQDMSDALTPQGIVSLLVPLAFNGSLGIGEISTPYLGVFPLLAAIVGIRRNWQHPWVRYLTGLAVAALLYALGPFSWLHGVLYAIVPKLWMAREAPRIVYLVDFALALLIAFGIDTLFARGPKASWPNLNRILLVLVTACASCLFVPAIFGKPEMGVWISLSLFLICLSYGLFRYILSGRSGAFPRFLLVAVILFDLNAFDWSAYNLLDVKRSGGINHLERALSMDGVSNFLKAQKGLFRVEILADPQPNIGDLFGVPSVFGGGVTMSAEYDRMRGRTDLLNVRYRVKPASAPDPGPVYQDANWKVYENPGAFPRAWLVHNVTVSTDDHAAPPPDADRTAGVTSAFRDPLEPARPGPEGVTIPAYEARRIELHVHAQSRALLVVSETFYPGWRARLNGTTARLYRVDGDLRGIVVPAGDGQVVLSYTPWSFYLGALLTLTAFLAVAYLWRPRQVRGSEKRLGTFRADNTAT